MPASSTDTPARLLGISGSLRRASNCTAVLRALPALLDGRASLDVMTLHDVPPYNADLEGEALPEGVRRLRQAITEADALVICSPEYNYSIPGVLKNAIDWASRPSFASPLKGKPALIVTASPGLFGGVRAQAQIRDLLAATLARPVARQHVAIPAVDKKIVDGRIADEPTALLLGAALDDLLAELALVNAGRP
ncbi:NADPH-dependent FMN reductase [Ideonella sp.]|uniref:NADPH-dependent FMN reductase n=1 Tax=Ideonella sp. TaxID=1929293 RepID=UPI002B4A7B4B|nr:NADPH-dependent FMN reductase [Ideonella sp.]HJV71313.1 NADPH-dependent FMN reductase [Ideonella sp.]